MNIPQAETMNRLMQDHYDNWDSMSNDMTDEGREYRDNFDERVTSDAGGSTDSQYKLPKGATQLQDLIEHRDMDFSLGNIFKACYRLGEKDSVSVMYDLKKIKWFVERMIARENRA
jgi:hypothetical protein